MKGALKNFCLVIVLFVTVFAIPISANVAEAQTTPTNTGLGAGFILFDRSQTSSGLSLDPATGNLIVTRQNNQTPLIIPAGSAVSSNQGTTVTFTKVEGAVIYTYIIRKNINGVNELIDATREDTAAMDEKGGGGPVRTYFYDQAQGKLATETDPQIARAYQILKNGSASLVAGFNQTPQATQLAQQLASPTEPKPEGDATKCEPGITNYLTGACIARGFALFADFVLRGTSYVLYIAGLLFDTAINYTVVNMKTNFDGFDSVGLIWALIRDIVNICFIFVMIAISIGTILQLSAFNVKQLLAKVILAALIMNFSLFYTKVLIDASNIVTLAFYSKMTVNDQANGKSPADGGLSAAFLNTLKVGSIYSRVAGSQALNTASNSSGVQRLENSAQSYGLTSTKYWDIFLVSAFGSIALIIVAIAFFSAAIMLIFRFFMLIVLLATSILPIASMILPQTASLTGRWWKYLWKELLALPVFMIVMYLSFITMKSRALTSLSIPNDPGFAGLGTSSGPGFMNTALSFSFTVALIFGAVIAAQSLGGYGAGLTGSTFSALRKRAQSVVGRNTLGRIAQKTGKGYDRMASSNFIQNTKLGKFIDSASGALGINSALQGIRGGLKKGEKAKYGYQSLEEYDKEQKGIRSGYINQNQERQLGNHVSDYLSQQERIEKQLAEGTTPLSTKDGELRSKYESALAKMSGKQLGELEVDVIKKIAKDIGSDQFDNILKSDKFKDNPALQQSIKDARMSFVKDLLPSGENEDDFYKSVLDGKAVLTDKQKEVIGKINPDNVHLLNPEYLDTTTTKGKFYARMLTKKAHDKYQESKNVGAYAKAQIKAERVQGAVDDLAQLRDTANPIPTALVSKKGEQLKSAVSAMDGKSLTDYLNKSGILGKANITGHDRYVIAGITQSQLEALEKEEVDDTFAAQVGAAIRKAGVTKGAGETINAYKYVKDPAKGKGNKPSKGNLFWSANK